jgi:hypothetical protein
MKAGGNAANFGFARHYAMLLAALNYAPFMGPNVYSGGFGGF